MTAQSLPKLIAAIGGFTFLAFGGWALADPSGFFDTVAVFEPYNAHFVRDIGAFQVGLGATLLLAAFVTSDALVATLIGVGAGAVLHVVSHVVSLDDGGAPEVDVPFLSVLGAVLLVAGAVRWARIRQAPAASGEAGHR